MLVEITRGVRFVGQGFAMLWRERSLWALSLVPAGFTAVALAIALTLVFRYSGEIDATIDGLWPVFEVGAWYAWLWVGPARLFFWILGALVFVLVAAFAAVVAIMISSVVSAPFLDVLSRRVERLATGRIVESDESGAGALLGDIGRTISSEASRMLFFLAIAGGLFAVGFVVPGAHLVTGPVAVVVTLLFLPLEYAGFLLDRRRVRFRARRRWVVAHWPRMIGFGASAFVICFVPGLNLLLAPGLVVAGSLLAIADPPSEVGPGIERPRD